MNEDDILNRITLDPDILDGKPVIGGMRLSVSFILNLLAQGATMDEVIQDYSGLSAADLQACFLYAAKVFDAQGMYTSPETYGIARRANAFYEESIRAQVEVEENIGKMIVIDSDTGEFAVDEKGLEASRQLLALHPGARLYGIRIGYNCAVSFGGGMRRIDANAPRRKKQSWDGWPALPLDAAASDD